MPPPLSNKMSAGCRDWAPPKAMWLHGVGSRWCLSWLRPSEEAREEAHASPSEAGGTMQTQRPFLGGAVHRSTCAWGPRRALFLRSGPGARPGLLPSTLIPMPISCPGGPLHALAGQVHHAQPAQIWGGAHTTVFSSFRGRSLGPQAQGITPESTAPSCQVTAFSDLKDSSRSQAGAVAGSPRASWGSFNQHWASETPEDPPAKPQRLCSSLGGHLGDAPPQALVPRLCCRDGRVEAEFSASCAPGAL